MKNRVRFFFLFLGLLGTLAVHAQINELPRSTPEAEGSLPRLSLPCLIH